MNHEHDELDLGEIEKALETLTLNKPDSPVAVEAITILAEASRSNESTREQLADPNILQILIEAIDCSINDSLETVEVALRCIGNACIDNDMAREEVTKQGFAWAKQCLPNINEN